MACSHFKCLTSHCVLGTSVPCQPGPGGSVLGEGIPAAFASRAPSLASSIQLVAGAKALPFHQHPPK